MRPVARTVCLYTAQGQLICSEHFVASAASSSAVPKGAYKTECKNCSFDPTSGILSQCKCRNSDAELVNNDSFDTKPCTAYNGDLSVNQYGKLYCEFGLPEGSYQSACHSCTTDASQSFLDNCQCFSFTSNDYVKPPKFATGDCKGGDKDITVNDGALICGYKLPKGDFQKDCMNCTMDSNLKYLQNCFCQNTTKDKYILNPPFDITACKGPLASIQNMNGILTCAVTIPPPPKTT